MNQKHRFKVDKLIRDKLPDIMRAKNIAVFERSMKEEEYITRLKDKLIEEAEEVHNADLPDMKEELADVLEVIIAIANVYNFSFDDIIEMQKKKKLERGGFDNKIYNAFVEIDLENPDIHYYTSRPDKYPEIEVNSNYEEQFNSKR